MKKPVSDRFWERVIRSSSCWEWTGQTNEHGYGRVSYGGKHWNAHRLAWIFSVGPIPNGLHVLHRCDNPKCMNPSHLWLGTHQDNMDDRKRKHRNRPPRGERCSMHVLTEKQVLDIRKMLKDGRGMTAIAYLYKISKTTVWNIQTRKTWAHLPA